LSEIDSATAIATADGAVVIANTADAKSTTTQGQLDTIVIASGTSDAETIQARGGEPLLYNRLDKVDTQLDDVVQLNVRSLGTTNLVANLSQTITDFTGDKLELYFPIGVYDLSGLGSSLTNTKDLKIVGQSKELTVIKGLANVSLFDCMHGIEVENVTFDTWYNVLNFDNAEAVNQIKIINCLFNNISGSVLRWHTPTILAKVNNIVICDNTLDTIGRIALEVTAHFDRAIVSRNNIKNVVNATHGVIGIMMGRDDLDGQENYKNITIKDNILENITCGSEQMAIGIMVLGVKSIITGNIVTNVNNLTGTDCEGIYTKTMRGVIANNILINAGKSQGAINIKGGLRAVDTSTYGKGYSVICSKNHIMVDDYTLISNGISCQTEDIIIVDNIIEGITGTGILFVGIHEKRNVRITGNIIRKITGDHGIWIRIPIHNLIISENTIDGINSVSACHGIRLSHDTSWNGKNIKIIDNVVTDILSSGGQAIALYFNSGGSGKLQNIVIRGNCLIATTRGILFGGVDNYEEISLLDNTIEATTPFSGVSTPSSIRNNSGYKTENRGTVTIANGTTITYSTPHEVFVPTIAGIFLSPTTSLGLAKSFWVSSVSATQFTVSLDIDPGQDVTFNWIARSPNSN